MTVRRGKRVLIRAIVMLCAAGSSSCFLNDLGPCNDVSSDRDDPSKQFMDGTWHLAFIDGAIFNGSFRLPNGKILTNATMDFHTLRLEKGTCGAPEKSSGEVEAAYKLSDKGAALPLEIVVGGFDHMQKSATVTLRALGYSGSGSASIDVETGLYGVKLDHSIMDITAKIPLGGDIIDLGTITYKLKFLRY